MPSTWLRAVSMDAWSRSISSAGSSVSISGGSPAVMSRWSSRRTRPTAVPELTPMPSNRVSRPSGSMDGLVERIPFLLEAACDEAAERVDGALLVVPLCRDDELGSARRRQQEHPVDALAVGRLTGVG